MFINSYNTSERIMCVYMCVCFKLGLTYDLKKNIASCAKFNFSFPFCHVTALMYFY